MNTFTFTDDEMSAIEKALHEQEKIFDVVGHSLFSEGINGASIFHAKADFVRSTRLKLNRPKEKECVGDKARKANRRMWSNFPSL